MNNNKKEAKRREAKLLILPKPLFKSTLIHGTILTDQYQFYPRKTFIVS